MAVLGILTCEILELEFAYLLNSDKDIARITVLENSRSVRMLEAIESAGSSNPNRISGLESFAPDPENRMEVLVHVLELGLHNRKRLLQEGLVEAACAMGSRVDALLLGYGLCGNALEKPDELLADAGVPVFIPMDEDHPVDDCIGLLIGGRERYYGEQCRVAGTFFMIPGWTTHWKRMFEQECGNLSPEMAKRLFKDYERSLMVSTSIMTLEEMKQNSMAFNEMFGLRTEVCKGTLGILHKTWDTAKKYLNSKSNQRQDQTVSYMRGEDKTKRFIYPTRGVCPPEIHFKVDNDSLVDIRFVGGGCPGNAQLVARLLEGKPLAEALEYLVGIDCRNGTSCPDQLAAAVTAAKNGSLTPAESFRVHADASDRCRVGLISAIEGNHAVLEKLLQHMQAGGIETCYCLGNLTGDFGQNKDLIQQIRKHKILAIQGADDWRYAQGQENQSMPSLAQKDRDWLLRLPQVLSFQMSQKKGIVFYGDYIQRLPDYSDFEPFALEMNMVCGLTNFMQDDTVFPALEAMIPQFRVDIIIFSQLKKWGHWHIAGKDFISLGPASDADGLAWGQLEIDDDNKIEFKVMQAEYEGG
jgi:uncharacterized protein (TIGR03905 family)